MKTLSHPALIPEGKDWHPKQGELVLTTPADTEEFGVLTRLEMVTESGKRIKTASGRVFYADNLLTTDACSIDYGRMKMLKATDGLVKRFRQWQAKEALALDLMGVVCEEYLQGLDAVERSIFREALLKVTRRRRPAEKEEAHDDRAPMGFYYIRVRLSWMPPGITYFFYNVKDELFSAFEGGDAQPFIRPPIFAAAVEHGVLKHSYEPLPQLEL